MTSSETCKYHPRESAAWFCCHCRIHFCGHCVPRKTNAPHPNCTLCRRSLSRLSVAKDIPPFWNRLSLFFLAPFNKNILIMLIVYSFLGTMLPIGVIGQVAFVILLIPFVSAEFDMLEKLSIGQKLNFTASQLIHSKQSSLTIKAFIVFALALLLVNKVGFIFGASSGYFLAILLLLGVPASLVIFMMEKNILSPINPLKIVMLIKLFGKAYSFLFLISLLTGFFVSKTYQLVAEPDNPFMVSMLLFVVSFYLVTVIFLMLGYLLYQYHVELNYSINAFDPKATISHKSTDEDGMEVVEIYLQEGRFDDAKTLLLKKVKLDPLNYKANEKLILLFAALNKTDYLQKLVDQYFSLLIELNKAKQAADFYCQLLLREVPYQPSSSALVIAMLPFMNNLEQYKSALTLLNSCSLDPAHEKRWDELALLKAKILIEYEQDNTNAISLFNLIEKRSLNQALLEEAENLANLHQRL
ncbi:MAG: hypothetical protein Q9M92_15570 [Enterobacterales bacterium]|nr:hypothetical protein [Enterobacterales bacterium]